MNRYNLAFHRDRVFQPHDAHAQKVGPWLDRVATQGEVVMQSWFRLGEVAVALGTMEDQWGNEYPNS